MPNIEIMNEMDFSVIIQMIMKRFKLTFLYWSIWL